MVWCIFSQNFQWNIFFKFNLFYFCIVAQLQLSSFFTIILPCPACPHLSHIQSSPTIVLVHGSFIHVPWLYPSPSFTHYPPPPPLWSLSVYSLFQCLWFILLTCLFYWLGPTYRWDHMGSACHHLLTSLSIMLSSSSMLPRIVGVPSFFLLCSIPLCKCTTVFLSTFLLMGT